MRKRVFVVFAVLLVLVIALSAGLYLTSSGKSETSKQDNLVGINEIEKLLEDGNVDKASEKLSSLGEKIRKSGEREQKDARILAIGGICVLGILASGLFVYVTVLRPLKKISKYTSEIARGNTDIPLTYERGSEVGEFSWAFDSMRKELNKARASEKEAIENNKTVIATLSHDIKTPVASIKSASEFGYELAQDEKVKERFNLINFKADELTVLVDNLFVDSVKDASEIKVSPRENDASTVKEAILHADFQNRAGEFEIPACKVFTDRLRLQQAFDNVFINSYKYADTKITVDAKLEDGYLKVAIRDFGPGVTDEEVAVLKEKYRRGRNSEDKRAPASGCTLRPTS